MEEIFTTGGASTELVILLHGLHGSPTTMQNVSDATRAARPDADILSLPLPFGRRFGFFAITPAECLAAKVVERIDVAISRRSANGGAYEKIALVGHSFGAVLARKVAIIAHGQRREAVFEPLLKHFKGGKEWAGKIERIVMLGGMSRGWSPAAARDWVTATLWTIGSWIGELMALFTFGWIRPTVAGIRQGAPFIIQTRLQWLALTRSGCRIPVVQLLGAADDLVAPDDSVDFCDLEHDRSSGEASFALVELPLTSHRDACEMSPPTADQRSAIEKAIVNGSLSDTCIHYQSSSNLFQRRGSRPLIPQARWHIFGRVVSQQMSHLHDLRINPHHMSDRPALRPDGSVTNVVFVVHGIRDHGFWTQKVARVIKQQVEAENHRRRDGNEKPISFRSFTGSYGYFAIVPFVLPWIRRWKAEWLMDEYVEARAQYPNASISYVGHSNGTYLLSRALRDYPAAYFDRAVLAGSVIRRSFDWVSHLPPQVPQADQPIPQICEILNYVATRDWVVGILSKAFQIAGPVFDLGSAGFDGFDQCRNKLHNNLHESRFVKGAHSAALVETQWDDIARFIIKGGPAPGLPDPDFGASRSGLFVLASWVSTLLLIGGLSLVLGFGVALTRPIFGDGVIKLDWCTAGWAAISAFYWWLVYIAATRF